LLPILDPDGIQRIPSGNRDPMRCCLLVAPNAYIEIFDFFSGPGSFAQECKAGLDTGIEFETTDINDTGQIIPPEMFNEFV